MSQVKDEQYVRMTETPVSKLIISLGIPTIISMLVTSIYNMADTYFVGTLGTSASGATGVVFGLMAIVKYGYDSSLCMYLCLLYSDRRTCDDFRLCHEQHSAL